MENFICKQGILKKEGKKKLQGKRKRWFDLNGQHIKYYDPDSKNSNEGSLLGTIDICEIVAVSFSKSTKYGFDIKTKTRTYYLEAKTEADRDDWMSVIEKACTQQQGTNFQNNGNQTPPVDSSSSKSKSKTAKKKKSRSSFYSENDETNTIPPTPTTQSTLPGLNEKTEKEIGHQVENHLVEVETQNENPDKPIETSDENQSLSDIHREFYRKLDTQLDDVVSDDDDEDINTDIVTSNIINPVKELDEYAVYELRKLLEGSDYENKTVDIESLSNKYDISAQSDYIHMKLLKAVLTV